MLKKTIKTVLILAIFLGICGYTDTKYSNCSVFAVEVSQKTQYIPPNLDYSQVIKYIKKEEGIVEEEIEKTATETEENENYSLSHNDFMEPPKYMDAAKECLNMAIGLSDEAERRHMVKKAFGYYKEFLKYYPGDLEALLGAGTMATYLGREEDAKNILMEAYATYPKNPRVHKALGDYSFKFSNFNNAIEYYNLSLLSGNLKDYSTNIATAVCYEKLGNIEKAITYFQVAHHLNPESKIAIERLKMYAEMAEDGYRFDTRMYEAAEKIKEEDDVELEHLIIDSQQIK